MYVGLRCFDLMVVLVVVVCCSKFGLSCWGEVWVGIIDLFVLD